MVESTKSEKPTKHRKPGVNQAEEANLKEYFKEHDIVCSYLNGILLDCYNTNPLYGTADYQRDCSTLTRRYTHEGLSFATKTLPDLFEYLLIYLETGISVYPGFKKKRGRTYPVFLQQLVAPIYECPYSADTVMCMQQLYQLCAAFKKLKGPYRQSVLDEQLVDFVNVDSELRYLELDNEALRPILSHAKRTITAVLEGLDPFDPDQSEMFLPRPGPGATNTPTKAHTRFQPHVKYTKLQEVFKYDDWFYTPYYPPRGGKRLRSGANLSYDSLGSQSFSKGASESDFVLQRPWDLRVGRPSRPEPKLEFEPTSRLKFVPKTFSKARGICIEQLETQYLQQGIKNALYYRIEHHPLTKGRVNFTDQSINGRLALYASSNRKLATIDMSSASDRISRKLVKYLFSGNEPMLDALLALSTETIELPDTISFITDFPCAKFAPMGSALCFPVMALVHFALIKAILVLSTTSRDNLSHLYIYGDDIIVPTECVQAVYDWLPMFGMKLNTGKSFHRSLFRESCGVHAYNGVDITPVRFKSVVKDPPRYNELISALKNEQALFYKGFKETARLIRQQIYKVSGFRASQFPVVSPKSPILGWIREDGDAPRTRYSQVPRRRWNADTHQLEFRVRVMTPKLDDLPPLGESEGYLRKLVTRVREDAKDVGGSCDELRIRHRWLPESAF
jgi:hypothetical protein